MTSILLCYYYVVHLHFFTNPTTLDGYNAIWTLFIVQLKDKSLRLKHAMLALKAPFYGSEVSSFCGDHRDRELN